MKCPVCKNECHSETICPECGFDQIDTVFVNKDDASEWILNVIAPFREAYWIRKKSQFTIVNGILKTYTGQETVVEVPYGVTVIGEDAFGGNLKVERIVLPATVREIQREAFSCCENLTEVTLNEGLEVIRHNVFECCDLLSITLPDSLTQLDEGFCGGGVTISIKESNQHYEVTDECLIDKRTGTLLHCWCDDLLVRVPHGVERVGEWAFPLMETEDRRVRLPEGVESIGFIGRGVQHLLIPSTVKSIDSGALYEVTRLHVSRDNDYFYCETGCVIEKSTGTVIAAENRIRDKIVIPAGIKVIDKYAFTYCENLRKLVIPSSVDTIKHSAFSDCDHLRELYFEHETAGNTWDSRWDFRLKAKCYWKGSWHFEPVAND